MGDDRQRTGRTQAQTSLVHANPRELVRVLQPSEIKGRVPPYDLDAEGAVLSACMLDVEAIFRARPILGDTRLCFHSGPNGWVWEGIIAVHVTGKPVDIISVADWLRDRQRISEVGGPSYLAELADKTPHVAHVESHALVVYEKWRLRAYIATCQKIAAEGYGDIGGTVQEFIDAGQMAIAELSHGSPARREPVRVGAVLGPELKRLEAGGSLFGIATGFTKLDKKTAGLHPGDLTVIAARPGMGKSAFGLDMAINIASPVDPENDPGMEQTEYATIIFSLEMPREQLATRAVCSVSGVAFDRVRHGYLEAEHWRRLTNAAAWLHDLPLWIDDTPAITAVEIRSKVRAIQASWEREQEPGRRARKVGLVLVDYLQLMRGRGNERNKEETVGNCSQDLKMLAKELRVPVIALAQLNRAVEARGPKDKRPMLADIRDSGQIEQDADAIIFIYRAEYYFPEVEEFKGIAELIVGKQRNGPPGKVLVRFDGKCTRFVEIKDTDYHEVARDYGSKA